MVLFCDEPRDKVLTSLIVDRIFGSMVVVMITINAATAITTTLTFESLVVVISVPVQRLRAVRSQPLYCTAVYRERRYQPDAV
jgi:hypothetical protein